MNNQITRNNPPGQGQSKKAKQRRAKKNRAVQQTNKRQMNTYGPKSNRLGLLNRTARLSMLENNLYLASLREPKRSLSAKIPDDTAVETGVFRQIQTSYFTVPASGQLGFALHPQRNSGSYQSYTGEAGWAAVGDLSAAPSIRGLYSALRVVSATLECSYNGSTSVDSGSVCGALIPGTAAISPGLPADYTSAARTPYSNEYPLRVGCRVDYRPVDNSNFSFAPSNATNLSVSDMVIMISGATAGQSVSFSIVINYKGIPTTDSFDLITTAQSPVNYNFLQTALNWAGRTFNNVRPLVAGSGWNSVIQNLAQMAINKSNNSSKNSLEYDVD